MTDIQQISITSTQTVPQPKPHTTYTVQSKEPPANIPAKHKWSITRSVYDDKIIRERKVLLEQYLRSILTTKDPRWRQSFGWSDFLAVPHTRLAGQSSSSSSSAATDPTGNLLFAPEIWTAQTWLTEQSSLSSLLRSARAALLKRDALAGMSDAGGSRTAGVEAKRILRDVGPRVDKLETELKNLQGLGEGERRRREEMVENLRVEKGNLMRMAEAGVRTAFSAPNTTGGGAGGAMGTMPGGAASLFGNHSSFHSSSANAAPGRVFGQKPPPPQETDETRPLDDRQLLQLQQTKMGGQDDQLKELSRLLQRQRKMGEEIHQEIGEQNEMLDDLDHGVDKTRSKLGKAKRDMNRLG